MKKYIHVRAKKAGFMIAFMHLTIRDVANSLGVSKSTIHKDVSKLLKNIDYELYLAARSQLDHHIKIRASRGGQALRKKLQQEAS